MVIAGLLAAAAASHLATAPISTTDLVEVTDISGVAISPDTRFVAFRTATPSVGANAIRLEWYVAPIDGSSPARAIADGGGPEIDTGVVISQMPVWAPSSRAFYFRAEHEGQVQVWRAAVGGASVEQVTNSPSDVRSLNLSPDGRGLELEVGATRDEVADAERAASDDGVLIDGSVDVVSALTGNGYVDGHPATTRFSQNWFERQPLLWTKNVHTVNLALRPEDLADGRGTTANAALSVRVDEQGKGQALHAVDLSGADHACVQSFCPTAHVKSVASLWNGSDVLVTTSDAEHAETLSIWTPASARWRKLRYGAGLLDGGDIINDTPCAVAVRTAVCVAAEPSGPPRVVSIDTKTGRIRQIFDPNLSLRIRAWPVSALHWKTSKGLSVAAELLLPIAPRPATGYPLVIDYYSCDGFLRGGLGDELPLAPLAQAGVATLCINQVRNAGSTEAETVNSAIDAVTTGLEQLTRRGLIDRAKVGMAGLSFGSQVTMATLQRTSLVKVAAISSAQIEPYYYWVNNLPGRDLRAHLKEYFDFGDPDTDKKSWSAHAPSENAGAIKAPLLIQIPESEMRLSMKLFSRLASSPTPVEMFAYPDETHLKWVPRHKLAVYERNLDWFCFWLLGQEDGDPQKADQYRRWRLFASRPGYALKIIDHATP